MRFNKKLLYVFTGITIAIITIVVLYGYGKYFCLDESPISTIHITHGKHIRSQGLTLYVSGASESNLNYSRPYKFKSLNDSVLSLQLDDSLKLRAFRCYFEYPGEKIEIKSIDLFSSTKKYSINLNQKFNNDGLKWAEEKGKLKFEVMQSNGFIDAPKHILYPSDFNELYKLFIPLLIVICFLTYLVYSLDLNKINLKTIGIPGISLAILILSEFLPAPTYNVALILGVVLNVKVINFKKIIQSKINLIFLAFFVIYLLNNLFLTDKGYTTLNTIERFLPFLVLVIIIPSIATRKYLILFPVSAISIGMGLFVTSIFDTFAHHNLTFLSFDDFSKYLHPVYYSYLLFFSICFIDLNYKSKQKYILEFVLFLFLIFSGSKIVFLFSLIVVSVNLLKNKKTALLILPLVLIVALFSPLKDRFDEILNKEDFTVLSEEYIEDPNTARVNGLTLRLILWRETLATMHGRDYVFGKGVTEQTDKLLENRLINLGLVSHKNFNPHNQYVDTFWRTGIIGLLFLILIPMYSLVIGVKRKDKLLIQFSLFMLIVMFSESIFGRVNGIYFFTTVILILMNTNKRNEDSHIRN